MLKYLHQLLRADAFDDAVIINLIDSETVGLLTYYFITGRSMGMFLRSFRLWKGYTRSNRSIDISIVVPDGYR